MKGIAVVLSIATVAFVAGAGAAQTRPDFSGRWTTEADPAAQAAQPGARGGGGGQAARGGGGGARGRGGGARGGGRGRGRGRGDMGSGWGNTISVTQDAAALTVEYVFFSRGDLQPPLKFVYKLDGSESSNSVMMGRGIQEQKSRTAWQGQNLVITTVHTFPHPETGQPTPAEVKQTLSLISADSLRVETIRAGVLGGPADTVETVYRKT